MITLHYAPDNASLVVKILLEELSLEYQAVLVDRSVQQQSGKAYLELNPKGLIPVCIIDDEPVFETAAIVLTLADRHGAMAPAIDDAHRPQFLKWLFFMSNTVHADLRLLFYAEKFIDDGKDSLNRFRQKTTDRVTDSFSILNAHYQSVGTTFLLGESPCIVDVYLACCMRWSTLYPPTWESRLKVSEFSAVERMLAALEQRPAVIRACNSEGINGLFFTRPEHAKPEHGSAL